MKFIIYIITALLFAIPLSSQDHDRGHVEERLESKRIAYITSAIELSSEEAQNFWPVYNDYRKEQKALRGRFRPDSEKADGSNKKVERSLSELLSYEQDHLDLKKKYSENFKQIIGEKRTVKLLQSERRFKEGLIKGLQSRSSKRRGKGGREGRREYGNGR